MAKRKKTPRKKAKRKRVQRPAKSVASMFGTAVPTKAGRRRRRPISREYRMKTGRRMGRLGLLRKLITATGRAVSIRRDITYWKTFPVESSWLTHIHLVELGVTSQTEERPRLAITYKSGVTCYYVDTTEADFNRMVTVASKGKLVHRMYYNQPYIVI